MCMISCIDTVYIVSVSVLPVHGYKGKQPVSDVGKEDFG